MSLALARKEVREHGVVFGALGVLGALVVAALLGAPLARAGRFEVLAPFGAFVVLTAIFAAGRLVVREFNQRTQLFLEVLPLHRATVLLTKYGIGAAMVLVVSGGGCLLVLLWQGRSQVIDPGDALFAFSRLGLFGVSAWAWAFLAGLLGRYRFAAWVAVLVFIYAVDDVANLPLLEVPILRFLDDGLGLSRGPPPARAVWEAVAFIAGCGAASAALGLWGEGALASALSGKMTARERVFVGSVVLAVAAGLSELKVERAKPPFQLADAVREEVATVRVSVMPTEELPHAAALALATRIAGDLDALATSLGIANVPPVAILPNQGLDPEVRLPGYLAEEDGVVVQAGTAGTGLDEAGLRVVLVHDVITGWTRARAQRLDRHWFLDGFSTWWIARRDPAFEALLRRRAAAARLPVTAEGLRRWDETQELLGECGALAYAFTAVDAVARLHGDAFAVRTAAALFERRPVDLRGVWGDVKLDRLLAGGGAALDAIAAEAEAEAERGRQRSAEDDLPLAGLRAGASVEDHGGARRAVVATLEGAPSDARWRIRYGTLGPWSGAADTDDLHRLDVTGTRATLPLRLGAGDRLVVAVELESAALGCPYRLWAGRLQGAR